MHDLQGAINEHNGLVRTNRGIRHCYREHCVNCGKTGPFAAHELRRRSLRYNQANSVVCVVIWLARWRCRSCRRTFTDYPDFRPAVQAFCDSVLARNGRRLSASHVDNLSQRSPL